MRIRCLYIKQSRLGYFHTSTCWANPGVKGVWILGFRLLRKVPYKQEYSSSIQYKTNIIPFYCQTNSKSGPGGWILFQVHSGYVLLFSAVKLRKTVSLLHMMQTRVESGFLSYCKNGYMNNSSAISGHSPLYHVFKTQTRGAYFTVNPPQNNLATTDIFSSASPTSTATKKECKYEESAVYCPPARL